jgi:hypothetical protein
MSINGVLDPLNEAVPDNTASRYPLFLSIAQAASYSGLSSGLITNDLNSITPLPHFRVGRLYYIYRDTIAPYYAKRCRLDVLK